MARRLVEGLAEDLVVTDAGSRAPERLTAVALCNIGVGNRVTFRKIVLSGHYLQNFNQDR